MRTQEYGPFGQWILAQLERHYWTQADLARRMGVDPALLSRWLFAPGPLVELRGRSANRLADALCVPVVLVLAHSGAIDPIENEEALIIEHLIMRIDWSEDPHMGGAVSAMLDYLLAAQRADNAKRLINPDPSVHPE